MAQPFSSQASRVALGGILTAGSLAMLYFASISPSGRTGLSAVAGLFPVVAVLMSERRTGFLVWGATSALGLFMIPDKGIALMYCLLFGLYPVLKSHIEGLRSLWKEWPIKLLICQVGLTLFWMIFRELFLPSLPDWLDGNAVLFYGVGTIVFIVYDIGLSRLISLLVSRIGGKGRK